MSGLSSVKGGCQDARPSDAAFELHLLSSLRDAPATHFSVRQPWDVGICSDTSARKRFLPGLPAPHRLPPAFAPSVEQAHPEVTRMQGRLDAAGAKFAKRAKHATWDAKETEEKNFALFKWLRIIERGPWDCAVSRDFLRARLLGLGAGELIDSISDALAAKSTSTLHARAGPILRYVAFCESEGIEPFPLREEVVYKFFYDMQAQVAATFFKSVLASFAFCKFVLGLDSAVLALESLRVKGLARKLYLGIRRLQQRPPLRVRDVIRLENICTGEIPRSSVDVVMAGFVLFMVYARARHSDAQHVSTLVFDLDSRGNLPSGFVDAEVKKTKTSYTVERKTKFLPMLAPARGLSGKCWASGWKATADVSAAHRLVLHRRKDWALMACRAEQNSNTVWINKVGTFGLSPASFWWSRLYGIIGRVVARCLLQHAFYHFAYVDDVHPTFYGKRMYINFLVWLILQEMIGVPFAYHKFRGKTLVAFIGYELDYGSRLVGLSEARGAWVRSWVEEARKARFVVSVRRFAEFLGRLGFVARVVYWIKPHLAPLYAWAAAASKSHMAKIIFGLPTFLSTFENLFAARLARHAKHS